MRILELPKMFRPATSHVYPPFKHGRYMEEYFYEFVLTAPFEPVAVYLPVFWTHLQNHPGFAKMRPQYQLLLDQALRTLPPNTRYFTVVQHDDGPQLTLPPHTIVYGACTGTVPLPLIYEDVTHRLSRVPPCTRDLLATFVGTATTHPLRQAMILALQDQPGVICRSQQVWSPHVEEDAATLFIELTRRAKFCLAPRGYGRSSFRFFEAIQLGTIPVYVWDDVAWLPYQDRLDYAAWSVSIHRRDLPHLYDRLNAISAEQYAQMQEALQRVKHFFTLEYMCQYVLETLDST